jgi:hypothetical protein
VYKGTDESANHRTDRRPNTTYFITYSLPYLTTVAYYRTKRTMFEQYR